MCNWLIGTEAQSKVSGSVSTCRGEIGGGEFHGTTTFSKCTVNVD